MGHNKFLDINRRISQRITTQKSYYLGQQMNLRRGCFAFPVVDGGLIEADLFCDLRLDEFQIQSPLSAMVAYRLEFFGIFWRFGLLSSQSQMTNRQPIPASVAS
jgi:hypothetical protein